MWYLHHTTVVVEQRWGGVQDAPFFLGPVKLLSFWAAQSASRVNLDRFNLFSNKSKTLLFFGETVLKTVRTSTPVPWVNHRWSLHRSRTSGESSREKESQAAQIKKQKINEIRERRFFFAEKGKGLNFHFEESLFHSNSFYFIDLFFFSKIWFH